MEVETLVPKQVDAGFDRRWVVKASLVLFDFGQRRLDPERRAIGPVRHHRLDHVGDREDLGLRQDGLALEALRVA